MFTKGNTKQLREVFQTEFIYMFSLINKDKQIFQTVSKFKCLYTPQR